jgi:hypothetical protein
VRNRDFSKSKVIAGWKVDVTFVRYLQLSAVFLRRNGNRNFKINQCLGELIIFKMAQSKKESNNLVRSRDFSKF